MGYIFSVLYASICIALAGALYKFGVPKRFTRKLVHILIGFEWVILYHFVGASFHFLVVCIAFLCVLILEYRLKMLPMMSSDSDNAPGTVYYALAMSLMATLTLFIPDMILPFGIGVFCTSLGDGLAGAVGQGISKNNPKLYGNKTLFGTLANFVISLAVPMVFNAVFDMQLELWHFFVIAFFSTELELFSGHGIDNIIVTLGVSGLSYALVAFPETVNYIVPIILTPIIIAFALKKKVLTVMGIVGAVFLDIAVSAAFGNFGFILLVSFFGGSIAIDKFKKRYKSKHSLKEDFLEKKSGTRDVFQVFANGFVCLMAALLYIFNSDNLFIIAFSASLAEAFADTAASGIGVVSKNTYDVFKLKKCQKGISGGISVQGTLSALIASFVIALITFFFGIITVYEMLVIAVSGFLGNLFDSMLGSYVQVKYRCDECGAILEGVEHCGKKAKKHSGIGFIDNDAVNFLSTLFSALLATVIFVFLL